MAAAFRPVNSLIDEPIKEEPTTSSSSSATPRSSTASQQPHLQTPSSRHDDSQTPTRATFSAASDQKSLPNNSFPHGSEALDTVPKRDNSQHSTRSSRRDSMDVDMDLDDSDGETGITGEDGAGSDDESVGADGSKSNKKKKSQRFYCTDYPPCNLSFTRSEHLARHIRKHTGERPFQCHCSRRFSRLDNLRQHAQTVHVNEDIPIDSLAATGSRFQRQMRSTERVRQAGNRARASTGGSAGGPARGHSKSLSTSSIASVSSVGSGYGPHSDARRRPPPLVMAADPRSRLSMESYRSGADSTYSTYRPPSPSDFSTPTSATFSTAQSSPRWASGMGSPTSAHSRSQSMYSSGSRTPGRRLSVPSSANPFQAAAMHHVFGPGHVNSSHPAAFSPAPSTLGASPSSSTSGWSGRRDSVSSNSDEAWRRRTWHPDSRNYANQQPPNQPNQLAIVNQAARPNPPPPIANPSNSQSSFRLPGIESFDPFPRRHPTPPPQQRGPSPMVIEAESPYRRPYQPSAGEIGQPDERRNLNMYDASLQRGLNRLDISHKTPPRDGAGTWASEANRAVLAQAEQVQASQPIVRFEDQVPPSRQYSSVAASSRSLHQHTMSAPSMATPRESKRYGWYHGPAPSVQGGQPAQDPRTAQVDRMVHPNFNGFSGFPAREQQPPTQQQERQGNPDSLRRLEALVAVATSEGTTATAY
ncbi:Up in starvation [Conoideocrella luteorostrata]|uniref:Up in starvation n=1 Tax=Conoideocrella luteorostrata TaxID=1105319 RepID=A0AAJ0CZ18_9HYPO|nr:Up in starvation [Conoideocrella luteorostrata]